MGLLPCNLARVPVMVMKPLTKPLGLLRRLFFFFTYTDIRTYVLYHIPSPLAWPPPYFPTRTGVQSPPTRRGESERDKTRTDPSERGRGGEKRVST